MHPFSDNCPIWKLERGRALDSYLRVPFMTKSWRMRVARKSNALVSLWKSEPVCRTLWKLAFRWSAWRACRTLLCESMRACKYKKRCLRPPLSKWHLSSRYKPRLSNDAKKNLNQDISKYVGWISHIMKIIMSSFLSIILWQRHCSLNLC